MAAQKVTKISLAEIYKRVPPNQIQKFLQFRDKNAQYRRRVDKYPEFLPRIDWDYYRNNVRCEYVKMVDEFEKKYEELNKIFDSRQQLDTSSYFKQVDEQRMAVKSEVEAYIVESNKRIKAYEAEIARIKSMIPYDQMTCEEFVIACPDKAPLIGCGAEPTFWPHIPEEQTPGPANPWLLEEMNRLLETGEPEPDPVPPPQKGEPPPTGGAPPSPSGGVPSPPSGGVPSPPSGGAPPPPSGGAPTPPSGGVPSQPAGAPASSPPLPPKPSTTASATSLKAHVNDAKTVSDQLHTAIKPISETDAKKMEEALDKAKKLATKEAKKMSAAADAAAKEAQKLATEEAKKMSAAADAAAKEAKKLATDEAKKMSAAADAAAKEAKKLATEEAKKMSAAADAAVKAATKEAAKAPTKDQNASSSTKPDSPTPASKRKGPDDKGKK